MYPIRFEFRRPRPAFLRNAGELGNPPRWAPKSNKLLGLVVTVLAEDLPASYGSFFEYL